MTCWGRHFSTISKKKNPCETVLIPLRKKENSVARERRNHTIFVVLPDELFLLKLLCC